MSAITEQLRESAKCAPLWKNIFEAAADEIERLQSDSSRYENLMKNGLICGMCGGCGSVGNPPDDYYDCPECVASYNKIKSDAFKAGLSVSGEGFNDEYGASEERIDELVIEYLEQES